MPAQNINTTPAGSNPVVQPNVPASEPKFSPSDFQFVPKSDFSPSNVQFMPNAPSNAIQPADPLHASAPAETTRPVNQPVDITPQEQAIRQSRVAAFEAGNIVKPAANLDKSGKPTDNRTLPVSYDASTNTYRDPISHLFYAGYSPESGHAFTQDESQAIHAMFAAPDSGVLTSSDTRLGANALGGVIDRNASPTAALPFSDQYTSNLPSSGKTTTPGAVWEGTIDPESKGLLDQIRANNERLMSTDDPSTQILKDMQAKYAAREASTITSIQDKADVAREDQKQANKVALSKAKIFFANIGGSGSSQALQYMADTVSQGERALRDIGNAERDAVQKAQDAFADQDFQLAFKQIDLADNRRKEYTQGLKDLVGLKQTFEQAAMQKVTFQRQMQAMDRSERQDAQKSATDTMSLMTQAGASADDIPEDTYQAWSQDIGGGFTPSMAKSLMRAGEAAKNAKSAQDMATAIKSATEIAKDLEVGHSIALPLPDGSSMTINGRYTAGSEDFTQRTMTLGQSEYGSPGQYIITSDKKGNTVNAIRIGDNSVAPYFDSDTQQWQTYNPATNTVTPQFNVGEHGEGTAGIHKATTFVDNTLVQKFGEPIKQAGGSYEKDVGTFMNNIAKMESGGNYKALGKVIPSGQYKGEQAVGKYQVMPGNIPSWTKEALGKSMTPQEFLNDPQAQEAVAKYKFNQSYQKYGNWDDVASVWFSGRPVAKAGSAKDVNGTTVPQYVKNVTSGMTSTPPANANTMTGWSFAAPVGSDIPAIPVNGSVVAIGHNSNSYDVDPGGAAAYGNYVDVQDIDTGAVYRYGNLSQVNGSLKVGSTVNGQSTIGKAGSTGYTTQPGFHFEVRNANGSVVTPNRDANGASQPYDASSQEQASTIDRYQTATGLKVNPKSRKDMANVEQWVTERNKTKESQDIAETNRLRSDTTWIANQKSFDATRASYDTVISQTKPGSGGFNDLAALNAFARIIDPASRTVTDSDMRNLSGAVAFENVIKNIPGLVFKGNKLTPESQQLLIQATQQQFESSKVRYADQQVDQVNAAIQSGVDPFKVAGTPLASVYEIYDMGTGEGVGTISASDLGDPQLQDMVQNKGMRLRLKRKTQ